MRESERAGGVSEGQKLNIFCSSGSGSAFCSMKLPPHFCNVLDVLNSRLKRIKSNKKLCTFR